MTLGEDTPEPVLKCWQCQSEALDEPLPLSRQAICQECFEPLRCCYMCLHFDESAMNRCEEDRADPPLEKGVANFCEFFVAGLKDSDVGLKRLGRNASAQSSLDSLFGGSEGDDAGASAKGLSPAEQRLKDLFAED